MAFPAPRRHPHLHLTHLRPPHLQAAHVGVALLTASEGSKKKKKKDKEKEKEKPVVK